MRLDPGMAFGTGSHATTRMCLELMDVEGKDVIDVGCGSGILGIAAKICGAKSVYMCDIDAQAVEFATKNAELNNVVATIEKRICSKASNKRISYSQTLPRIFSCVFKEYRQTPERKRHYRVVGYH